MVGRVEDGPNFHLIIGSVSGIIARNFNVSVYIIFQNNH